MSLPELTRFQRDGHAWVATTSDGDPIAYLLLEQVDGNAHVEQVSVHPGHARQGIGKALLDNAGLWAERHGLAGLTLTTFAHAPWNAPYYQRLGFQVLSDGEQTDGLRRIREREAARGLDQWPRVTMRRPIHTSG